MTPPVSKALWNPAANPLGRRIPLGLLALRFGTQTIANADHSAKSKALQHEIFLGISC